VISAHRYFNGPAESIDWRQEAEFFAAIRLQNRTYKKTAPGRLGQLDSLLVGLVAQRGWTEPAVLDVGVSSGITTRELLDALRQAGIKPAVTATDIALNGEIVDLGLGVRALLDSRGHPLQFEWCGVGLRAWNRRLDLLTGYRLLTAHWRRLVARAPRTGRQHVKLVSRQAATAADAIAFIEDDLSVRNPALLGRFNVIRAANILNRLYFGADQLRAMIANLAAYAKGPGTLIAVLRTHDDGTNHGTVYQLAQDGKFVPIERIGAGSEIDDLV
jgi:hypothetical protein